MIYSEIEKRFSENEMTNKSFGKGKATLYFSV